MLRTSRVTKLNPSGMGDCEINFPGFQEILDFTSDGSEASVSVTVDGDTDKEYKIVGRNTSASVTVLGRCNSDAGNNYGYQYLFNDNGSISAARAALSYVYRLPPIQGISTFSLLTPTGFIKTGTLQEAYSVSGTSILYFASYGFVWNNTANVTLLTFAPITGNFEAGTRIAVYCRRSN